MSIKCVSLETAKALKEDEFPQETYFNYGFDDGYVLQTSHVSLFGLPNYAAPSSDEILEELPEELSMHGSFLTIAKLEKERGFSVDYGGPEFVNKSLPEALAAMWLYLKKEGLL